MHIPKDLHAEQLVNDQNMRLFRFLADDGHLYVIEIADDVQNVCRIKMIVFRQVFWKKSQFQFHPLYTGFVQFLHQAFELTAI